MIDKTDKYISLLKEIKTQIKTARIKAALSVNQELVLLYWNIGRQIAERQEQEGWGSGFIEKLAKDLQNAFPGIKGFSRTNIFLMRQFFLTCQKIQQAVGQLGNPAIPPELLNIPWGHNIVLLSKIDSPEATIWYAQKTIHQGWSRGALKDAIKGTFYERSGKSISNFPQRLPAPQSELVQETIKNPYNFDFLALSQGYREEELELGLINHIEKFLIELGEGFALVGRQYPIEVSNKSYHLDLLFYHLKLRCFCVIELKATEFKPAHAGQLNFYLSAVDSILKQPQDNPTIGMLLCKTKDKLIVEYALRDIEKPIGVAEYETKILESLPEDFKGKLPSVEEIEEEFKKHDE